VWFKSHTRTNDETKGRVRAKYYTYDNCYRFDPERLGTITLEDVFKIYALLYRLPSRLEDIYVTAFQEFDKEGKGIVNAQEFKAAMRKFGEKLAVADADQMIKDLEPDGEGNIHYVDSVQSLLKAEEGGKKVCCDDHCHKR